MSKKPEMNIKCSIEYTQGAEERIMAAFVELYYQIENGQVEGPLPRKEEKSNVKG